MNRILLLEDPSNTFTSSAAIQSTSKIHQFSPTCSLKEAIHWLVENDGQDAALIFEDESSITFKGGKFVEFEDMSG